MVNNERFATFEAQMGRASELGALVPPQTAGGSAPFFDSFRSWFETADDNPTDDGIISVFPNPSYTLAFPYPRDEISVALSRLLGRNPSDSEVLDQLARFGVPNSISMRPTTSLSGGERLLVGLSKADAYSSVADKLLLCSPSHWLNRDNFEFLTLASDSYTEKGKVVNLLTTLGEPYPTEQPLRSSPNGITSELRWQIALDNPVVHFPEQSFPKFSPGVVLAYSGPQTLNLHSPTLLVGTNGVGKSVFSKLLSGNIKAKEGSVFAIGGGAKDFARLVMQDSMVQLFGNSPLNYIKRVFHIDKEQRRRAKKIYSNIENHIISRIKNNKDLPLDSVGRRARPGTVLQGKIALAAERIASRPPAIILDEPGWCLSRPLARLYLGAVTSIAHDNSVAIMLISHLTDWWDGMSRSTVTMYKAGTDQVEVKVE